MASRTLLWISKRSANCPEAGAIIEEAAGLINVNADTIIVAPHLFLRLQLRTCQAARQTQKTHVLSRVLGIVWTIPVDGENVIIILR
jgi:hypothetical protein